MAFGDLPILKIDFRQVPQAPDNPDEVSVGSVSSDDFVALVAISDAR